VGKIYLFFNWHAMLQCSFIATDCWTWRTAAITGNCSSNCVTCWHYEAVVAQLHRLSLL